MKFFYSFVHVLFHLGYFGPFVMGILDSSFLVLPFGNDFLVVGMVARHHHGIPWFVLSAACGSTVGVCLLALVSRKLGEEGVRKFSGQSRYEKLKKRIGRRFSVAIALAGVAPPPFPFTLVIAAAGAMEYPLWRILAVNFLARAARFTVLSILASKFGQQILGIAKSSPFEWSMIAFIALCLVASAFSVAHWLRRPQPKPIASGTGG